MAATPAAGRETRLLVVTLVISAAMLLLLARLRFPDQAQHAPEPPAAPLERLAARATYEELAGILRGVDRQIADAIVPVRVAADVPVPDAGPIYVPAVRLSADYAVALAGVGRRVVGLGQGSAAADVVATDAPRGLAVLRVPASGEAGLPPDAEPDAPLPSPGYLAGVEATRAGPAVRPLYFGRADRITDPRWPAPVIRLSALQQMLPAGAAVFTLDGRLVGAGVPDERDFLIVPAALLRTEASLLMQHGSIASADLGIEVQRLDTGLRAATGADDGVVVAYVAPKGPGDGLLAAGDVIGRMGTTAIAGVADYAGALAGLAPGHPVDIEVRRGATTTTLRVTPATRVAAEGDAEFDLGLDLRAVRGAGSEVVRVAPRSAGGRAGLAAGDLITAIGGEKAPDPARVTRMFNDAAAGSSLLVVVERGATHLVLALAKP